METDTKAFGVATVALKALDPDDPAGTFEAILSAPTLDRDGEVIDARAFEPLPDHITIDVDHGMSTAATVGSGVPYYDGDLLKIKGTFSTIPRAQEVRTLVTEGHIRKMSVAFMNAARQINEDDGKMHILRAELLNAAIVPIPSNREASILAAKSGARNSTKDAERLQNIHDLAVANGALCSSEEGERAHVPDDVKTSTEEEGMAAAPAPAVAPLSPAVAKAKALAAEAELLLWEQRVAKGLMTPAEVRRHLLS